MVLRRGRLEGLEEESAKKEEVGMSFWSSSFSGGGWDWEKFIIFSCSDLVLEGGRWEERTVR